MLRCNYDYEVFFKFFRERKLDFFLNVFDGNIVGFYNIYY